MRMMCIRGRHFEKWHTGLVAGQVYDVTLVEVCGCANGRRAFAEGSVFHKPRRLSCDRCGNRSVFHYVPWGRDRFAPWEEPKVSKKEVEALYAPRPNLWEKLGEEEWEKEFFDDLSR